MSFGSYSTTPASNISINGINIDEGCPAANVNNAIRQLASDGRELYNTVVAINVSGYMPLSGGAFTGAIWQFGQGRYLNHVTDGLVGSVYTQLSSAALPSSPGEGTIVLQYS